MKWLHDFLSDVQKINSDTRDKSIGKSTHITEVTKISPQPVPPRDRSDKRLELELSESDADLQSRLSRHGVSIAVDPQTGDVSLLCSASDAEAVEGVLTVPKPFGIKLTERQRRELLHELDH